MIKAIFLDIDGTLVSFQTHDIPTSTIEAIASAKQHGVRIFIATGRAMLFINNLEALQKQDLIDGYITVNGNYCIMNQQVIYKGSINDTEVESVLNFCTERQRSCIVVGEHDLCVCHEQPIVTELFRNYLKVDYLPERPVEEALKMGEILQLTPFISEQEEAELFTKLSACESGRWYPAFTDITALGSNKEKGIAEVIKYLGIDKEEIMAFGDGGNDISMLRYAGIGVAMGNANDNVKAMANYVTDSVDNDGIRNALLHFGIIR